MKNGLSGDTFAIIIVIGAFLAVIIGSSIFFISHKKGIDITKNRFDLKVGLSLCFIFLVIPIMLSDMSIIHKIFVSLTSVAVGLGHYFAVDKISNWLKAHLGKDKQESL